MSSCFAIVDVVHEESATIRRDCFSSFSVGSMTQNVLLAEHAHRGLATKFGNTLGC